MFLPKSIRKLLKRTQKFTINSKKAESDVNDEKEDATDVKLVKHHVFTTSMTEPQNVLECPRNCESSAADLDRRLANLRRRRTRRGTIVTFSASTISSTGSTVGTVPLEPTICNTSTESDEANVTPRCSRIVQIVCRKGFQPYVPRFRLSTPLIAKNCRYEGYAQNASHFKFRLTNCPDETDQCHAFGPFDLDDIVPTPSPDCTMPSPMIPVNY